MNIKLLTLIATIFIMTAFSISAKSKLSEYKCHVLTEDKIEAVIDVSSKVNSTVAAEKLVYKKGYKLPQNKKKVIKEVFQCIPSNIEFSTSSVRTLDENTLR